MPRTITLLAALLLALAIPGCGEEGDPEDPYPSCEEASECQQPYVACAYPDGDVLGYCTMWCRSDADCPPTEDGLVVPCSPHPDAGSGRVCLIPQ